MKKIIFVNLLFCLVQQAAVAFICPKTYQQVQVGQTEAQVLAVCGEPLSKQSEKVRRSEAEQVDVWAYDAKKYYDRRRNGQVIEAPQITLTFAQGTLSSIKTTGVDVSSVQACGIQLSVGSTTQDAVQASCGAPNFKSTQTRNVSKGKAQATTWVYQFGPYQPRKTLLFYNGKLFSIK